MNSLDAILLDMDGTILDTTVELCQAVATAVNRIVPTLSLHHSQILTDYPNLYGGPLEEFHDTIVLPHKPDLDEAQHKASTAEFIKFFLEAVELSPPSPAFSDVVGALESIRSRYPSLPFGVATTKPTRTAESDLSSPAVPPSLRPLLGHVQGTDKGTPSKPAPDVLFHCAKSLGVDVKKCIYVGDTSRDAEAGFAAGCAMTITVRRDGGKDEDKLGADALIQDFSEIEAVAGAFLAK